MPKLQWKVRCSGKAQLPDRHTFPCSIHMFCVLHISRKTGFLKTILIVYAGTVSESLVSKVSLLDEAGIGMTDIGRSFWFPQRWMVDWGGGGGYSGCNFRAPGRGARTWV